MIERIKQKKGREKTIAPGISRLHLKNDKRVGKHHHWIVGYIQGDNTYGADALPAGLLAE